MKILFAIYATLICLGLYGYFENILKLIHACSVPDAHFTIMIVVRIVGVLTGILGAIAGYF